MNILGFLSIALLVFQRNSVTRIVLALLCGVFLDTIGIFAFGTHTLALLCIAVIISGISVILFSKNHWSVMALTVGAMMGVFILITPSIERIMRHING